MGRRFRAYGPVFSIPCAFYLDLPSFALGSGGDRSPACLLVLPFCSLLDLAFANEVISLALPMMVVDLRCDGLSYPSDPHVVRLGRRVDVAWKLPPAACRTILRIQGPELSLRLWLAPARA